MHDGEVDIDVRLVEQLVAGQFPQLAHLPIDPVTSTATVNAIYRLGDRLCVRLPRVAAWAGDLLREWRWLPILAPQLTLRIPEPVELGHPISGYPFSWAIYRWIDGRPYTNESVDDEAQAAQDLARFVLELRRVNPVADAPRAGRGSLADADLATRASLESARGVIDSDAAIAAWEQALRAPAWTGTPVWIHADLLRPNILLDRGRPNAVIDFGGAGVGDPATDVIAAWSVFSHRGRSVFRVALDVDDGTWNRARGIALQQAAMIIPYYLETNPGFIALAVRTVQEIVSEN